MSSYMGTLPPSFSSSSSSEEKTTIAPLLPSLSQSFYSLFGRYELVYTRKQGGGG